MRVAVFIFFTLILISGCSSVYRPYSPILPSLGEKNELHAQIGAGSSGNQVLADYKVTNKVAILGNVIYDKSKARVIDTLFHVKDKTEDYQLISGTFGLSFQQPISENFEFGVSGTLGGGILHSSTNAWTMPNNEPIKAKFTTFSVQPFARYHLNSMELAFVNKLSVLNYFHVKTSTQGDVESTNMDLFSEPGIVAKIGNEKYKFIFNAGYALVIRQALKYDVQSFIFGIGINVNLSGLNVSFDDEFEDAYSDD